MYQTRDERSLNGLPSAGRFRIDLDLVGVDGTPRDGGPQLEPILRRLKGAAPYRDMIGEEAITWLRFVRRACNAALQANKFASARQRDRVVELRRALDQRISTLADAIPQAVLAKSVPAPGALAPGAMQAWLGSGSKLGFSTWRASVCTWAIEDGQAF